MSTPLRFLFLVNPVSGGNDKEELVTEITQFFSERGFVTRFHYLDGETDHPVLREMVEHWKPDRVVAVGGDGTLKLAAELLKGSHIPVGLIPAGSANGMARELNIPSSPAECMELIAQGNVAPLDVVMINGTELSLHLSDIGFNAQLVREFEKSDGRGKWAYLRHVFGVLLRKKQLKVRIRIGNKEYRRRAFMIVIANSRMYGTGAMINPEGDLSDGEMEIVVLRKISLWELGKMFLKYRHFNPRKTEILKCREVKIVSARDAYFQVDGEYQGKTRELTAHVERHALHMLLPLPQD
ncbi:MAG: NAD(+)/NADH kinase [Flavipsychrobacter sp.]|nr:NAD(+)/NADH kinase [Flavipsychrobacter sp.]